MGSCPNTDIDPIFLLLCHFTILGQWNEQKNATVFHCRTGHRYEPKRSARSLISFFFSSKLPSPQGFFLCHQEDINGFICVVLFFRLFLVRSVRCSDKTIRGFEN